MNESQYEILQGLITSNCDGMTDEQAKDHLNDKTLNGTLYLSGNLIKIFAATTLKGVLDGDEQGKMAIYALENGIGIDMADQDNLDMLDGITGVTDTHKAILLSLVADQKSLASQAGLQILTVGQIERAR